MQKINSKYSKNNKFNKDCKLQQTFGKFLQQLILAFVVIFVAQSFWLTRKILVTFAIFGKFADFSRPFLAVSLYKSTILLNLLFLLFLRYLQEAVSQNFLVNLFFFAKKKLAGKFLRLRSILDLSFNLAIARLP